MRNTFTLILTLFICNILCAQIPTQTIRGRVVDSESQYPLVGVKLEIKLDDVSSVRALTDTEGNFEFSKIPVGKYQVVALYAMYENKTVTAELSSGKELILTIALTERVSGKEEVSIIGRKKGEVLNDMAMISAQQFSVSETNRYPGSRMDPARMASNFAGVQGSDDSRNENNERSF